MSAVMDDNDMMFALTVNGRSVSASETLPAFSADMPIGTIAVWRGCKDIAVKRTSETGFQFILLA